MHPIARRQNNDSRRRLREELVRCLRFRMCSMKRALTRRRYNTPLFYDAGEQQLVMGGAAVPGMLVRHSAHLLVDRQQQQQQQQQQQVSQPPSVRLLILMGGAFCFSFGCVFSPCYEMTLPLLPPSAASAPARALVEVDVLLCPKVGMARNGAAIHCLPLFLSHIARCP